MFYWRQLHVTLCAEICFLECNNILLGRNNIKAQQYASKIARYLEVFGVGMPIYLFPVLFASLAIPDGMTSKCMLLTGIY